MPPELLTLLTFLPGAFYLAWADSRTSQVPFLPLVIWAALLLTVNLAFLWGDPGLRILTAAFILLGGGLLWLALRRRLGLADVFFVTVMALAFEAWVLYFSLVAAVILGLLFFIQFWLKFGHVRQVSLPFVPLLVLGSVLVLVARGWIW